MVHLDPELKKKLAMRAVVEGRSMSEIVRGALACHLWQVNLVKPRPLSPSDHTSGIAIDHTMTFNEEA